MKRTNTFTLAALAALCLAGCTQDDERTAAGLPMTGTPMRVVAHVDAPVTREAMTTADLTRYYFRVTDADGGTDEYDYFTTMTLEDGQWTADQEMTWQSSYPQVSALEQYGVDWDETDYTTDGKDVSVQTDQSDRDALLKSDLLYMAPKTISTADLDAEGNIKVNLAHRFAKLKVVVNITKSLQNPITALTIGGTKVKAHFTPETNTFTLSEEAATDITAYCDPSASSISTEAVGCTATYECILLPQELAANTLSVIATTTDQVDKEYQHSASLSLKGNYEYTLRLKMEANGSISTSGSVAVGGWGNQEDIGGGELEEGAEIIEKDGKTTYYVSTARGLLEWAEAIDGQESTYPNLTLTKDIDMTGKTWPYIVFYSSSGGGIIDGGGHTISNLTLTEGTTGIGLIALNANGCTIKNLTLQSPHMDAPRGGGFFIGGTAGDCTIENCHVIGGTTNGRGGSVGGLVSNANNSSFTACSVTSSGVDMIGEETTVSGEPCSITACYVTGGKLVGSVLVNNPTYTASYYQESAGGIMDAEGNTVADWNAAATQMNAELSETSYEWVENPDKEDTDRPLVIQHKTTD